MPTVKYSHSPIRRVAPSKCPRFPRGKGGGRSGHPPRRQSSRGLPRRHSTGPRGERLLSLPVHLCRARQRSGATSAATTSTRSSAWSMSSTRHSMHLIALTILTSPVISPRALRASAGLELSRLSFLMSSITLSRYQTRPPSQRCTLSQSTCSSTAFAPPARISSACTGSPA